MILKLLLCCPVKVPHRFSNAPIVDVVCVTVIVSTSHVPPVVAVPDAPFVGPANTVAASKSNLCDKKK